MEPTPFLMYSFMDQIHYENIERYEPTSEYHDAIADIIPSNWKVVRKGFWCRCTPPNWSGIKHGWKIHASSSLENAIETLSRVATELVDAGISFKYCSDPRMLKMSMSKGWSRFQAGKFIAVYPRSQIEFEEIVERLHLATRHLIGPHILTDRLYSSSKVIYYRYGAHVGEYRVDPYGRSIPGYILDDGSWCEDIRGPSFHLPSGCTDPFGMTIESATKGTGTRTITLADRYLVRGAIKFNATGGIYYGTDTQTGRNIVIREVRGMLGHLESEMPEDPAFILKREARILEKLSGSGVVPEFIDLFQEWNNWFLVEEKLDAVSLWGHSMDFYYSNEYAKSSIGLDKILLTVKTIGLGLKKIHDNGIVLRDLTRNNVMFTKDGSVKFIDFEFAFELEDNAKWVRGWTPGYASSDQVASKRPTLQDDYYAFGALILDMLTFSASGMDLSREAILIKLHQVLNDLKLPLGIHDAVIGLTAPDPNRRWNIEQTLAHLDRLTGPLDEFAMFPAREDLLTVEPPTIHSVETSKSIVQGLLNSLHSSLDLSRQDRLWPASPEVFITNPVSLQYGAAGPAWFMLRSTGMVDNAILDWIEEKSASRACPPGLYSGLGGVALLMLATGRTDSAERLLSRVTNHELSFAHPGLYFGSAGQGLVSLHFWRHTGETRHLLEAIRVAERLLLEAKEAREGIYWTTEDKVYLGLGDGQSGVALFLIYLAMASSEERYLHAATKALEFDVAHSVRVAGRITWKTRVDSKESDPNLPHTRFGAAGIGSVCVRHFSATGDGRFKDLALDCAHSVRTRVTNKIWQDSGSAGYGEFLLDMAHFLKEPRFAHIAHYHAEAIAPHKLNSSGGINFAGTDHYRVCCDFGTGGAGIGVFLDRLLNRRERFLMLDGLLPDIG